MPPRSEWEIEPAMKAILFTTTKEPIVPLAIEARRLAQRAICRKELERNWQAIGAPGKKGSVVKAECKVFANVAR
jgi:hypothetical protein